MEPDAQERPEPRPFSVCLEAAGRRDQRAQPVEHEEDVVLGRDRQARPKLSRHVPEGLRASVQHPQQVHEGAVPAEPVGQRDPPFLGARCSHDGCSEEELVHRAQVVLAAAEPVGVRHRRKIGVRRQHVRDQVLAEELVNALARLSDDRVRIEPGLEDAGHVVEQPLLLSRLPERRGGPDADQIVPRPEPHPQAPDEAGEVGSLGAVEGVQLVHHQVAQRARRVPPPELLIRRTDQQVVEHLVVREQDVRRLVQQRLPVRDHLVRPHPGRARRPLAVLPDEEPRGHPSPQARNPVDRLGDPSRLVGRQRVHRVDDDGLDARSSRPPVGSGRGSGRGSTRSSPIRCRWR